MSDIEHFFCSCEAVVNTWSWLKRQVEHLGQMGGQGDDWEIVNLCFVNSSRDTEIVWLVSCYVLYVWEMVHVRKLDVKLDKFFGFLTFKYKVHQATSPNQLENLHYI